ncbi:hypothetical protein FRC08_004236 [Ceratobasidium sp. 394]|nr:hypothetical protein FRC08_004236 [Ceratobasidium sp. 394]
MALSFLLVLLSLFSSVFTFRIDCPTPVGWGNYGENVDGVILATDVRSISETKSSQLPPVSSSASYEFGLTNLLDGHTVFGESCFFPKSPVSPSFTLDSITSSTFTLSPFTSSSSIVSTPTQESSTSSLVASSTTTTSAPIETILTDLPSTTGTVEITTVTVTLSPDPTFLPINMARRDFGGLILLEAVFASVVSISIMVGLW